MHILYDNSRNCEKVRLMMKIFCLSNSLETTKVTVGSQKNKKVFIFKEKAKNNLTDAGSHYLKVRCCATSVEKETIITA